LSENSTFSDDTLVAGLDDGSTLGPFRVVGLLGRGGMASVYEAHEPRLHRAVALKVLPPEFLHDETFALRFEQEARVVARLEHPNIVPIYASGIDDGMPWVSMRLLSGGTLSELLSLRRPLPPDRVVHILTGIAKAIDYAHTRGVIHRDIKPSNILLDDAGHICVTDFGVARLMERGGGITTATGTVVGTPQYMAPEQALGLEVDRPCDLYSLGVVAYEMLTGAPPFAASSPVACLMKHVNDPFPVPDREVVSTALAKVLEKAMAKDPNDRWPTATAFVDALAKNLAFNGKQRPVVRWMAGVGAVLASGVVAFLMLRPTVVPVKQPLEARSLSHLGMIEFKPVLWPTPPTGPAVEVRDKIIVDLTADPGIYDAPLPSRLPVRPPVPSTKSNVDPPVSDSKPGDAATPTPTPSVIDLEPTGAATPNPIDAVPTPVPPPSDIVSEAVITQRVEPIYPAMARTAAIEGTVVVEAECGIDGIVINVRVLRPAHRLLDEAATDAVRRYRCQPRLRNGQPEVSSVRVPPIVFALK
jgi:TonB family protein